MSTPETTYYQLPYTGLAILEQLKQSLFWLQVDVTSMFKIRKEQLLYIWVSKVVMSPSKPESLSNFYLQVLDEILLIRMDSKRLILFKMS